jgi:hypothetical protein
MAAGPWFTVRDQDDGWQTLDRIWISNGETHEVATLEYRSILLAPDDERALALNEVER